MGKTSIVCRIAEDLACLSPVGFYTTEIRVFGSRRGFELVSLDGTISLLAYVDLPVETRVGRFGVDVDEFDRFLDTIPWEAPAAGLVVIDEIGRMECLSEKFRFLVRRILDGGKPVLATVARRGGGFIAEVKARVDVEVIRVTKANRDKLPGEIVERLVPPLRGPE